MLKPLPRLIAIVCCLAPTVAGWSLDEEINPKIAIINGEPVYAAEVSIVMQSLMAQLGKPSGSQPDRMVLDLATSRIIEQKLLAQEARRFGLAPDEQRVARLMELAAERSGGEQRLAETLAKAGSELAQLEQFYRELELGRVLIAEQIRPTIDVTDDEVLAYYEGQPEAFNQPERVRARQIVIRLARDADSETEKAAHERASRARERAVAGDDFAELARRMSDGPTAASGGDLGYFSRDMTAPELADVAFALAPGEISQVVRTDFGLHVLKVEEHLASRQAPLEEAIGRARVLLINQRTGELVQQLLQVLTDKSDIELLGSEPSDAAAEAAP